MNKFFFGSILLLFCNNVFCQLTIKEFEIPLASKKIKHSLYKTISFVDSRYDTTNMGIVQLLDKRVVVNAVIPVAEQLSKVMNSLIDETAGDGELLFQLRKLHFVVIPSTPTKSKEGYCYLRAVLYSKVKDQYKKIASIDTIVTSDYIELTKVLLKESGLAITKFISNNLLNEAVDSNYYSLQDVEKLDSIEKRKIKLYNTNEYKDGIYLSYQSFMNQVPDKKIVVEMRDSTISYVKAIDDKGKKITVKEKDIYGIVYLGQPYILTTSGYHLLQKRDDDFFYIDKPDAFSTGDYVVTGLRFGLIGGLILSAEDNKSNFEMRIDHITGRPIHNRIIKDSTGDQPPVYQKEAKGH